MFIFRIQIKVIIAKEMQLERLVRAKGFKNVIIMLQDKSAIIIVEIL